MKDQPTQPSPAVAAGSSDARSATATEAAVSDLERRNAALEREVAELRIRLASASSVSSSAAGQPDRADSLAIVDVVTGLPNRLCFQDRLLNAIDFSERYGEAFAVLFIDLDEFKSVNDTMGHSAGDDLLREIAGRLTGCVRKSDTVARLGGDEFTIILLNLREPELMARVAEKIIGTLSEPFMVSGRNFFLSASIGIASYPEDGTSVELLIRNADTAMYEVKKSGKNGYHFYTREMSDRAISRIELEDDLRRAIAEQQFVLHFQANVDTHTQKTVAAEALVRWQHPVKGLVDPEQFMPLAEETGLICEIGQLALASACEHARAWQRDGYEPISIAVNLSAAQFEQTDLIDNVMECLVASNLDSHWLRLELTEEALLRNADHAREALYSLRELGITIAIDDFGTGYTSLIQLQNLPIDCLKIDQAFIPNLPDTREEASLLEAIVALGRKLNLSLLAEGVETTEQLQFLRELGCQSAQGCLFGGPVPAEEFTAWLAPGFRKSGHG